MDLLYLFLSWISAEKHAHFLLRSFPYPCRCLDLDPTEKNAACCCDLSLTPVPALIETKVIIKNVLFLLQPRHMVIPYMPMLVPPEKWTRYVHTSILMYILCVYEVLYSIKQLHQILCIMLTLSLCSFGLGNMLNIESEPPLNWLLHRQWTPRPN